MTAAEKLIASVFQGVETEEPSVVLLALNRSFPLVPISDDAHLETANRVTEKIIDFINDYEASEPKVVDDARKYLSVLVDLVGAYEKSRFETLGAGVSGGEVLKYMMDSHGLKQTDLAEEVGGQSVVSDILRGERELNAKQIRRLSERFKVSPAAFF